MKKDDFSKDIKTGHAYYEMIDNLIMENNPAYKNALEQEDSYVDFVFETCNTIAEEVDVLVNEDGQNYSNALELAVERFKQSFLV
jgi:hypothetical protein